VYRCTGVVDPSLIHNLYEMIQCHGVKFHRLFC